MTLSAKMESDRLIPDLQDGAVSFEFYLAMGGEIMMLVIAVIAVIVMSVVIVVIVMIVVIVLAAMGGTFAQIAPTPNCEPRYQLFHIFPMTFRTVSFLVG